MRRWREGLASAFVIRWPIWPSGPRREGDRARADIHDGQELKRSVKGRIQKRKTHDLQIVTFGLQRAAGPYRWATSGHWSARCVIFFPSDADCDDRPADWISERKKLEPRGDYIWP